MDTSICTLLYNHLIPHFGQFCLKKSSTPVCQERAKMPL
jgi:hypothetical protein